jgi:hypothetical protein
LFTRSPCACCGAFLLGTQCNARLNYFESADAALFFNPPVISSLTVGDLIRISLSPLSYVETRMHTATGVHIELTPEEMKYVRAALTLVLLEREELIDTGRFAKELGDDTALDVVRESAVYEEQLRTLLARFPAPGDL